MIDYARIIASVLAEYPDLDVAGFQSCGAARGGWSDYEPAFWSSLAYAQRLVPTKGFGRYAPSSYGLKHDVERMTERGGGRVYTPNGVMIAALVFGGIRLKRDGINATAAVKASSRVRG